MQGRLQIIDQKKNLFKLSIGESVGPEKIGNSIIQSLLIAQCSVYGDSFQNCLVSVVVPDGEPLLHWAKSNTDSGVPLGTKSFVELCHTPQLKTALMAEIQNLSRENGLREFEIVKDIHIEVQFTSEKDLVTPTFKLKRNKLCDAYQKEINSMYVNIPTAKSKL